MKLLLNIKVNFAERIAASLSWLLIGETFFSVERTILISMFRYLTCATTTKSIRSSIAPCSRAYKYDILSMTNVSISGVSGWSSKLKSEMKMESVGSIPTVLASVFGALYTSNSYQLEKGNDIPHSSLIL